MFVDILIAVLIILVFGIMIAFARMNSSGNPSKHKYPSRTTSSVGYSDSVNPPKSWWILWVFLTVIAGIIINALLLASARDGYKPPHPTVAIFFELIVWIPVIILCKIYRNSYKKKLASYYSYRESVRKRMEEERKKERLEEEVRKKRLAAQAKIEPTPSPIVEQKPVEDVKPIVQNDSIPSDEDKRIAAIVDKLNGNKDLILVIEKLLDLR